MKVDVIGSNSLLFENLPPASQVPGRTYRVSNVGPAPGILLTSDGTRWRPSGGRQLLAMRSNNPVTIQDTAGAVAETIGPFPGGLVLAGMKIETNVLFHHPGVGTSSRVYRMLIGNSTPIAISSVKTIIGYYISTSSAVRQSARNYAEVNASNDTAGPHQAGLATASSFVSSVGAGGVYDLDVNFSLPWYVQVQMQSCNETAVNISSATWAAGIATFNTAAAHTLAVGDKTVIASVTPSGYNGTFIVASVPTTTQFTVALAANPGTYTSGGTSSRISNMISQSYVLELVG